MTQPDDDTRDLRDDLQRAWALIAPPLDQPLKAIAIALLDIASSLRRLAARE